MSKLARGILSILLLSILVPWNFSWRITMGLFDGILYGWWDTMDDVHEAYQFWQKGFPETETKKESP